MVAPFTWPVTINLLQYPHGLGLIYSAIKLIVYLDVKMW